MKEMVSCITNGIKISVETFYQDNYSNDPGKEYVFAYRITIENKSTNTIQVLRRHWFIYDTEINWREVEGEGVVGEQPTIEPGHLFQYVSACNLRSTTGKMFGSYLIEQTLSKNQFEVSIPEFFLVAPYLLN